MNLNEEKNRIRQMMGLISEEGPLDFNPRRGIVFDVYEYENFIILDELIVPDKLKGKGYGGRLMDDLCEYADDERLAVIVEAGDGYGTPLNELITFYSKWGFQPFEEMSNRNTEHSKWLIRYPYKYKPHP